MQTKQWIVLSAIAIAAGAAMADEATDTSTPLTREQVVQSVLAARAAHQLRPAGAAGDDPYGWRSEPISASHLARSQVTQQVLAARTSGTLRPAGEAGDDPYGWRSEPISASNLTRAQVVAETLRARANGELIPAGEGPGLADETETHFAHVKAPQATVHAQAPSSTPAQ